MAFYPDQEGYGRIKVYVGGREQRGNGIGSFLGGLFRRAIPLLTAGAKVAGREAAKASLGVLTDIATRRRPPKDSIRLRLQDSTTNLKRAADEKINRLMTGSGYKKRRIARATHSRVRRVKRQTTGRKKKIRKAKSKVRKTLKRRPLKKKKKTGRAISDIFG